MGGRKKCLQNFDEGNPKNGVTRTTLIQTAWGGVVIKTLRYQSEGPGIDPRWGQWGFFPWYPTIPYARGRLSLLK
jgi:hypothetical protein